MGRVHVRVQMKDANPRVPQRVSQVPLRVPEKKGLEDESAHEPHICQVCPER